MSKSNWNNSKQSKISITIIRKSPGTTKKMLVNVKRHTMPEKVKSIEVSKVGNSKYKAVITDGKKERILHFGDKRYGQYKDDTKLKKYKRLDHGDKERRKNYFQRHSGVENKHEAIKKEYANSKGKYTPKLLSHIYLW